MDTLLDEDIDTRILAVADELAERFVEDMSGDISPTEFMLALAGLQLHFLSRVARLIRE